jgi:hypothetical protein
VGRAALVERLVLAQDGGMKVAEGSARVDPQPVAKRRSEAAVQHEGLTLQPVPVQGEHQVLVDLLVQRMFPGQRVQFRRQLGVLAERQPGLGQRLVGREP